VLLSFGNKRVFHIPLLYIGAVFISILTTLSFIKGITFEVNLFSLEILNQSQATSFGLNLNKLIGLLVLTVSVISCVVLRFSNKLLVEDKGQNTFMLFLAITITNVMIMLMSPNLIQFFIFWILTSLSLDKLLKHFHNRSEAVKAAKQKFIISRIGDLFIAASIWMIGSTFNSFNFELINTTLNSEKFFAENAFSLNMISILLTVGVLIKSAQFPFHSWLPRTMETPVTVSALMHAGIVNAGGFLLLRLDKLLVTSSTALMILIIVGGITTLFAITVMLTQTNVKQSLAYSTIAQMGFMIIQCGLGAFSFALIHMIGHAFYKAYKFLSSGTQTDLSKLRKYYSTTKSVSSFSKQALVLATSSFIFVIAPYLLNLTDISSITSTVLLFVLSLTCAQFYLESNSLQVSIKYILSIISLYFFFGWMIDRSSIFIETQTSFTTGMSTVMGLFLIVVFSLIYFIQNNLDYLSKTNLGRKIYVLLYNGAYIGKN
tara:strand:- start:152 stop:1615 length:1464 start_codon:yes stop_codon:yes gene_type:complete